MAKRRDYNSLSPAYRKRLERGGITKAKYEAGANLSAVRGHEHTPEHGLKDVAKNPTRFEKYLSRVPVSGKETVSDTELEDLQQKALASMDRKLGNYIKYRRITVINKVIDMTVRELRLTIMADVEQLRTWAKNTNAGNPWHYH